MAVCRETKVPSRHRGVLQGILFPKWDTPGADARQLLKAWESQMQEYEQQSRDEISNTTVLVVGLHHLPDASHRGHPLLNSRTCNEYDLVPAEIRTAATARTTCTGLTPMDLGILAKEAVCHVCGKGGYFTTDCWCQAGKESEKGTKPKDSDNKKNGAWDNCIDVGHYARNCTKKQESSTTSFTGGGDLHCLNTDDQPKVIMMLAQVGPVVERLNNIEFLVDSGAVCHVRSCRTTASSSLVKTLLTVTGTPVASQGTLEVKFLLINVHGEKITVKAMFELFAVRRPILSVNRLVGKGFVVAMGKEDGHKVHKGGREIHLHKSNGVHRVHVTTLSELCPLEDLRNDDGPPAETVGEVNMLWTRRLPYRPKEDERMSHSISHFPF